MHDDEPRTHIVVQATRQAVVHDLRRARVAFPIGLAVLALGLGGIFGVPRLPVPVGIQVTTTIVGALLSLIGVGTTARSLTAWVVLSRKLRGIDARALPTGPASSGDLSRAPPFGGAARPAELDLAA